MADVSIVSESEHGHAHGAMKKSAVVLTRPDGTPMSRQEVIIMRRGAFKWLPVLFSNDLVHGSWWFVVGSFVSMVIAIVPIVQNYYQLYPQHDDALPRLDHDATWSLLIVCGFFYTVGSWAFVRAFEEPPKLPLFHFNKHFQTDELLGAWLFLVGTLPSVPYALVYFSIHPTFPYMVLILLACTGVLACVLFVLACYPNPNKVSCLFLKNHIQASTNFFYH